MCYLLAKLQCLPLENGGTQVFVVIIVQMEIRAQIFLGPHMTQNACLMNLTARTKSHSTEID